jgi:nicotinate-nucleotide pyrophosphorylase (carboxylating)
MHNQLDPQCLADEVRKNVAAALTEDVGSGDISASLIAQDQQASATVITRENGVFCGKAWVDETIYQVDQDIAIEWRVADADTLTADQVLFTLTGGARSLLTVERTMLNFVQLLSGTATRTARFVGLIESYKAQLLDTRKTVPGLRLAQKHAVRCGGGSNHRIGLFDAFLLKENHVAAAGGISAAIKLAQASHPGKTIEVEVETLEELDQATLAGADIALVDNFSIDDTKEAVRRSAGKILLEASGGIEADTISKIAATGVDFISSGDLTKSVDPLDLSMRFNA